MCVLKLGGMREVKDILRNFALNCSQEQLVGMYNYATSVKLSPFLIDLEAPKSEKVRKGFNEMLNPSDFGEDEAV